MTEPVELGRSVQQRVKALPGFGDPVIRVGMSGVEQRAVQARDQVGKTAFRAGRTGHCQPRTRQQQRFQARIAAHHQPFDPCILDRGSQRQTDRFELANRLTRRGMAQVRGGMHHAGEQSATIVAGRQQHRIRTQDRARLDRVGAAGVREALGAKPLQLDRPPEQRMQQVGERTQVGERDRLSQGRHGRFGGGLRAGRGRR